ncbi:hypothetical protein EDWATA_02862 [Edwardsiella tarda ATCC 23685]|uniref:Uncharacterized protein n=1 Tax=Edwardsiella tarda ATCC 23685 TaxID=500638 RepID=D4F7X6_EDWTA|nr:hypothetical protein EDWATA_02862 [Edwardsiella tarda ATCC 23685]
MRGHRVLRRGGVMNGAGKAGQGEMTSRHKKAPRRALLND